MPLNKKTKKKKKEKYQSKGRNIKGKWKWCAVSFWLFKTFTLYGFLSTSKGCSWIDAFQMVQNLLLHLYVNRTSCHGEGWGDCGRAEREVGDGRRKRAHLKCNSVLKRDQIKMALVTQLVCSPFVFEVTYADFSDWNKFLLHFLLLLALRSQHG